LKIEHAMFNFHECWFESQWKTIFAWSNPMLLNLRASRWILASFAAILAGCAAGNGDVSAWLAHPAVDGKPLIVLYQTAGYTVPPGISFTYAAIWPDGRIVRRSQGGEYLKGTISQEDLRVILSLIHRLDMEHPSANDYVIADSAMVYLRIQEGSAISDRTFSEPIQGESPIMDQILRCILQPKINDAIELSGSELDPNSLLR
jgi:hypothetical protein